MPAYTEVYGHVRCCFPPWASRFGGPSVNGQRFGVLQICAAVAISGGAHEAVAIYGKILYMYINLPVARFRGCVRAERQYDLKSLDSSQGCSRCFVRGASGIARLLAMTRYLNVS